MPSRSGVGHANAASQPSKLMLRVCAVASLACVSTESLTVRKPLVMNFAQSAIITTAGVLTQQTFFSNEAYNLAPIVKMLALTVCFIVPINIQWFKYLGSLKLHWVTAALVDQFLWSPIFNIGIFAFLDSYDGGISLTFPSTADTMSMMLTYTSSKYASVMTYRPVWSTQVTAYLVWLPATLLREAVVPPHLVPVFVNIVAFLWNIIFALLLA